MCPDFLHGDFLIHGSPPIRVLNTIEDGPDIPMLDDYAITKPLSIFGEVLFDRGVCVLREGKKQKQRTMTLTAEIGYICLKLENFRMLQKNRVKTSRPLAMPSKLESGTRLRWVLTPAGRYPFFRRLAPWRFHSLGCWTAQIAATLDTVKRMSQFGFNPNGTEVL